MGILDWAFQQLQAGDLKSFLEKAAASAKEHFATQHSEREHLDRMIAAYKDERLVLVLGAGISMGRGVPSWKTLLHKLLFRTMTNDESNSDQASSLVVAQMFAENLDSDPIKAARYLQNVYQTKIRGETFEEAVRSVIYSALETQKTGRGNSNRDGTELFDELRALCLAPGRSPVLNSVVTYNYDNLLEESLRELAGEKVEIKFRPIYASGMRPYPLELPIYHVHGYLPNSGKLKPDHKITLGEVSYHEQYSQAYSWQNTIQLNKFADFNCLMIGLSFTDPNLRRLLDIANEQYGHKSMRHAIVRKRYSLEEVSRTLRETLEKDPDYQAAKAGAGFSLDQTAKQLTAMLTEFEENDAASFGVGTIWIDDYDELPAVVRAIRRMDHVIHRPTRNAAGLDSAATAKAAPARGKRASPKAGRKSAAKRAPATKSDSTTKKRAKPAVRAAK